jgi:prophage regulatory protein
LIHRQKYPNENRQDTEMTNKEPRTLLQFRRWLEDTCDDLEIYCRYAEPDFFDQLEIAQIVEDSNRLARRLGAGEVVGPDPSFPKPSESLAIVGRLLRWANEQTTQQSELMSVEEVGQMLGISARTVWRMASAGEIPQPVKFGGTKWRRTEIQTTIDLLPTMKG